MAKLLEQFYRRLHEHFGAQSWWPGRTRFEVIAGAILTQNTAWTNVEKALRALRVAGKLNPQGIRSLPAAELGQHIRASGYWRQKAKRLKAFVAFLDQQYAGSLTRMFQQPTAVLRQELLAIPGIGPETADSILLYAGGHPSFVIDAYTRRILERHALPPSDAAVDLGHFTSGGATAGTPGHPASPARNPASPNVNLSPRRRKATARPLSYQQLRSWFEAELPREPRLYNEFHALIVQTGKTYCLKRVPRCEQCPLAVFLPESGAAGRRVDR